jgi:hypothetical protein
LKERAQDIELRENLTHTSVEKSHEATTEYLIAQHNGIVYDLRKEMNILV